VTTLITPNGCRWCGLPERDHYRQWKPPVGWHGWVAPTDAQRKDRMLARRAAASAESRAAGEAAASTPCMACGTIGVCPGTLLCEPCRARPYGTVGAEVPADEHGCVRCWEPRYVWFGNMWAWQHRLPGALGCVCECHAGQVWLASDGC
jgi:hypothetical protein